MITKSKILGIVFIIVVLLIGTILILDKSIELAKMFKKMLGAG